MAWTTIDDGFQRIRSCTDDLFDSLWRRGHLRYRSERFRPDTVDQVNARLVCSALEAQRNIAILLPDCRPHRPALLFATGILRYWFDHRKRASSGLRYNILYFGTTTGIRDQLGSVEVSGGRRLTLSEVFQQTDMTRRGTMRRVGTTGRTSDRELPRVHTIYSPVEPTAIIEQHRPWLIAVDCADVPSLPWLKALLLEAQQKRIPVIAWGQNPFAECVSAFAEHGSVFVWPPLPVGCSTEGLGSLESTKGVLLDRQPPEIRPVIIESDQIVQVSSSMREAARVLLSLARRANGRLTQDALRVHWRYLSGWWECSVRSTWPRA